MSATARERRTGDWRSVARTPEVHEGRINKASVAGLDLILLKVDGEVLAYEDRCPHEGHPLSQGELEADVLICARHLWEFEVKTGRHVSRINRPQCNLKARPIRVVGGVVEVDVSGAGGAADRGNEKKD
jgi:nitrite reductase/ring-hydroxylating ferredoxin subunit